MDIEPKGEKRRGQLARTASASTARTLGNPYTQTVAEFIGDWIGAGTDIATHAEFHAEGSVEHAARLRCAAVISGIDSASLEFDGIGQTAKLAHAAYASDQEARSGIFFGIPLEWEHRTDADGREGVKASLDIIAFGLAQVEAYGMAARVEFKWMEGEEPAAFAVNLFDSPSDQIEVHFSTGARYDEAADIAELAAAKAISEAIARDLGWFDELAVRAGTDPALAKAVDAARADDFSIVEDTITDWAAQATDSELEAFLRDITDDPHLALAPPPLDGLAPGGVAEAVAAAPDKPATAALAEPERSAEAKAKGK